MKIDNILYCNLNIIDVIFRLNEQIEIVVSKSYKKLAMLRKTDLLESRIRFLLFNTVIMKIVTSILFLPAIENITVNKGIFPFFGARVSVPIPVYQYGYLSGYVTGKDIFQIFCLNYRFYIKFVYRSIFILLAQL